MGILQNLINKAVKPVGGSSFFEAYGVPGATTVSDQINSYRGVVYACVSAIAEEVGKIQIQLFNGDKEVTKHWLLDLLQNPNPEQRLTQYNLFELLQTYQELTGEHFWYMADGEITKKPKLIFNLRPDKVNVVIGKNGAITGYTFTKDDATKIPFEVNEILHFKMPNPTNNYRGMGTVAAGMVYIQTEKFSSEWTRNSFYNDASPRGILSLKGTITEADFEAVKRKWNKEYAGVKNANKTAILKGIDVDYTKIGVGLDEVAIKELRNMSRDDIMMMFRVSKPILGIVEDVNLANAKTSHYIFMQRVIKPKMERIVDTLQALVQKEGLTVKFVDPVEEDDMEKASYYEKMLNVGLTINEIRQELGRDAIEGGDSFYQPMNLLPVGDVLTPTNTIKLTQRKTIKKTKVKTEQPEEKVTVNKLDKNYIHWKSLNSIENAWYKRLQLATNKVLAMQKKDVLAKLKPKRQKDVTGYEPDKEKYKEIWLLTLAPIALELTKETGGYAAGIVGTDYAINKSIEERLTARIAKVFTEFDAETSSKLSKSLLEGMGSEESLADLAKRVDKVYGADMSYRSERIARTETHKIANEASVDAYKQSSVVTGMQWYSNPGACGFCEEMNGKIVDLNTPFVDLGGSVTYIDEDEVAHTMGIDYEPIGTGDLHPNCQCTQLPWSADYEETGQFSPGDAVAVAAAATAATAAAALASGDEETTPAPITTVDTEGEDENAL